MEITRRNFLGASAALVAASTFAHKSAYSANEKVRVCVIGLHGRGRVHMEEYSKCPNSELVALCDADGGLLRSRARQLEKITGKKAKTYVDMRDVMADKDIDAISIATPNHWHTLAAVWGLQAGKDVYVEKPASWSFWEGQQLIAAAEKSGRVLQHGTQSRSSASWLRDIPLLQSGDIIGPLYMARGLCYKTSQSRDALPFKKDGEPPRNLNWRLWQGPASEQAYNPNYVPYNWHWFWHYGNGEIGNQGVHQLDIATWGLNRGLPVKVTGTGGRFTYEDQGQTPNTMVSTFTYEDGTMLVFEVRNRYTNDEAGVSVGNLFYASDGYYVQEKGFFDKKNQPIAVDEKKYPYPKAKNHFHNFIDAVRNNDPKAVFGNATDAHISSAHAHLANTSYRIGTTLKFDPKTNLFTDNDEANALMKRDYHPDFTVPTFS